MEQQQRFIIGAVIGILLIAGLGRVEAEEIPIKGKFAGTSLGTRMDRFPLGSPDGSAAGWFTSELKSNLGKYTMQGVSEALPTGPTAECPGGVSIIDAPNGIGAGTSTGTWPNGDQLYNRIVTSTLCSDTAGRFTATETGLIVGGAGKFAGASGTYEASSRGFLQYFDPNANPPQWFGSLRGEFEGTLILP